MLFSVPVFFSYQNASLTCCLGSQRLRSQFCSTEAEVSARHRQKNIRFYPSITLLHPQCHEVVSSLFGNLAAQPLLLSVAERNKEAGRRIGWMRLVLV